MKKLKLTETKNFYLVTSINPVKINTTDYNLKDVKEIVIKRFSYFFSNPVDDDGIALKIDNYNSGICDSDGNDSQILYFFRSDDFVGDFLGAPSEKIFFNYSEEISIKLTKDNDFRDQDEITLTFINTTDNLPFLFLNPYTLHLSFYH